MLYKCLFKEINKGHVFYRNSLGKGKMKTQRKDVFTSAWTRGVKQYIYIAIYIYVYIAIPTLLISECCTGLVSADFWALFQNY